MAQSIRSWIIRSAKTTTTTPHSLFYYSSPISKLSMKNLSTIINQQQQQQKLQWNFIKNYSTIMNNQINQIIINNNNNEINKITKRFTHKPPLTVDYIRERILLVLRLYDKIDPDKLTIDSHFYKDLGLDSLDHVEIIMAIEDEFHFEIPDGDAEKLNTPRDLLNYIQIKEEIYSELEHHHHDDHHHNEGHH